MMDPCAYGVATAFGYSLIPPVLCWYLVEKMAWHLCTVIESCKHEVASSYSYRPRQASLQISRSSHRLMSAYGSATLVSGSKKTPVGLFAANLGESGVGIYYRVDTQKV